jgi:uncharacterized protein YbjT (DUF2867 family)
MRVLLTGATGLIGRAVLAALSGAGHEVVAVARGAGAGRRLAGAARVVALDLREATDPDDWQPHLAGIDAVVSCAGVLQDGPGDSTERVHAAAARALYAACEAAGVRRLVHVSALGVDGAATAFTRSKLAGDEALMASALDWVILRPSVVAGRPAYGGSALFRGLAVLPVLPRVEAARPMQVVQLDDVVRTVLHFLPAGAPTRLVLELAGPEPLALEEVLAAYRRWLGWPPARIVPVPEFLARALFRLGDAVGRLGWRPPVRSTALTEIARGAVGDPGLWTRLTGIVPRRLADALAAEPASVQERWFARLYLLKPVVVGVLALTWTATGLLALGPARDAGVALIAEAGAGPGTARALTVAGAPADILIGAGIAVRRTARPALSAALVLSLVYLALGTALLPRLWADPLGPLLKIAPILALNLVALAILDDR